MRDMDSVVDWSGLLPELLAQIASLLVIIEDFMAFRGVCASWRATATKNIFVSVSKVPLLMLSEKDDSDEREFYSLSKGKICTRIPLPGAKGKRCIDVGFGWILTLASSGEVCLLKPFSSAIIELPNYTTFPFYDEYSVDPEFYFIIRGVLTANPSETSNFMILVDVNERMGFWRGGDENWTVIDTPSEHMVYLNGKMYSLDMGGNIEIWDPLATDVSKPQVLVQVDGAPTNVIDYCDHYLVASTDGELLLITRNNTRKKEYIDHFDVMRVDLVKGECQDICDLGKDAIFLGYNAAVSVDATEFPGVLKPNCIYFTDRIKSYYHMRCYYYYQKITYPSYDKGGGKEMGIYHVEDESIERFNVESFSRVCPPMWIFPSF